MSTAEKIMQANTTVPELIALAGYSEAGKIRVYSLLETFGSRGTKGFDLSVAALGILARKRVPEFDDHGEHKPFIFEPFEDADGSLEGFKYGLSILSDPINVAFYPEVIEEVSDSPEICAEHLDSDLVMLASLEVPSRLQREDLGLARGQQIAAFTIIHFDGLKSRFLHRDDYLS